MLQAAEIGTDDVLLDVGFGSGEQDFLLSNACEFRRLIGFNISERQVRYANERAIREHVAHKLSFRLHTNPKYQPGSVMAAHFQRCRGCVRLRMVQEPDA